MRIAPPLLLLLALAAPALAQDPPTVPDHLVGMVGDWRLEQEDQSLPTCALVFTDVQTEGGWAIEVPEPCPAPFPPADRIAIWSVDETDGTVLILDAAQAPVLRLLEDEDGLFITPEGQLPAFYLMLPWDADGTGGEIGDEFGEEFGEEFGPEG